MSPQRLLVCTDLDRTLIPNGIEPESPHARRDFARLCAHEGVTLAYVSGRNRQLVGTAIRSYRLPPPDFAITDVGTRIYDLRSGEWRASAGWEQEIAPDWAGRTHAELRDLFRDLNALHPQKHEHQDQFKLSYHVSLHEDRKHLSRIMQERLQALNVKASLIWSVDEPARLGLLDVTPRAATKLHAVEFIRTSQGFTLEETVYAGDSGNDLAVLVSPIPSVLVANASPQVREEVLRSAQLDGTLHAIYCAVSNELGNGNYSNGILDGILHYRPDVRSWMEA